MRVSRNYMYCSVSSFFSRRRRHTRWLVVTGVQTCALPISKTAAKWLEQYGSLEEVVRHSDEIGGAVGENLRKALDWLPKAQALLAVKCDLELPVTLEELKLGPR